MADSSGLTDRHKSDELKKKLSEFVKQENQKLSDVVKKFFASSAKSDEDRISALKAVIASFDNMLSAGDWDSSLFLRAQAKRLLAVKKEAESELQYFERKGAAKSVAPVELAQDEQEVYISLFQSDGYNLDKWAVQLRSLSRYVVGRPVYGVEEEIQKRIRLRAASVNEAYVVVAIKKADIKSDPFETPPKDQFGHTLLQLSDFALQKGKIIAFVHQKTRYDFFDGQLVKAK